MAACGCFYISVWGLLIQVLPFKSKFCTCRCCSTCFRVRILLKASRLLDTDKTNRCLKNRLLVLLRDGNRETRSCGGFYQGWKTFCLHYSCKRTSDMKWSSVRRDGKEQRQDHLPLKQPRSLHKYLSASCLVSHVHHCPQSLICRPIFGSTQNNFKFPLNRVLTLKWPFKVGRMS